VSRICLFIIGCLFLRPLAAQQLDMEKYSPDETLPFSYAYSMTPDARGFLWFTTGTDVYLYTGNEFRRVFFSHKNPVVFITKIELVNDQLLFLSGDAIYQLEKDSLVKTLQIGNSQIIDIIFYQNKYWFCTTDGIYNSGSLTNPTLTISDPLPQGSNLFEDILPLNDRWLVSWVYSKELIFYDLKEKKAHHYPSRVMSLSASYNHDIYYVDKDSGMMQVKNIDVVNGGLLPSISLYAKFKVPTVKLIRQVWDAGNNCWISLSNNGLLKIDADGQQRLYDYRSGLPEDMQSVLLNDRENNIWLSSTNGLIKIRSRSQLKFTMADGLMANAVSVFLDNTNGNTWTTSKRGINKIVDDSVVFRYAFKENDEGLVHCIPVGNRLYLFYQDNVKCFDATTGQLQTLFPLKQRMSDAIFLPSGDLLLSLQGGLKQYSFAKKQLTDIASRSEMVRSLCLYKNYFLSGEHANGIALYTWSIRNDSMQLQLLDYVNSSSAPGIPDPTTIRSIIVDSEGMVWVGTRSHGIFRFAIRNNKLQLLQHISKMAQFDSPNIIALIEDKPGILIANTARGIFELHKDADSFRVLPSTRFPRGNYSLTLVKDKAGNFWYALSDGLLKVTADKKKDAVAYTTYITSLINSNRTYNFPLQGNAQTRFPYSANSMQLFFSTNYFTDERKLLYSYCIGKEKDSNWSAPSATGSVNLLSLQPGQYFFKVKAILPDGSETIPASFRFTIARPFWRTWWFYSLVVLTIGSTAYYIYRSRINRIRNEEALRNKIARDLHDDIGSTLSGVKLYSSLAYQKLDGKQEDAAKLVQQINEKTNTMMDAMSDIVWSINPRNDSLQELSVRMKEYAAELFEPNDVVYSFETSGKMQDLKLDLNQRKEVFLLFKESINNIIKHAGNTTVAIRLLAVNRQLVLEVQDNGKGFDEDKVKRGNGLYNLVARAQQAKGSLQIRSKPGEGTFIRFTLPIG
jgi:ligand-binding sensor domain-containing protein/two-component sensor histidine kinase